jgi:flagellar basal-body rod modification protein FlgD
MNLDKAAAGTQTLTWDGKTDSGERATSGVYKFEVNATDSAGHPIEANQTVSGVVSGVFYENGFPELMVGTTRVPLSNISSISQ